MAIIQAAPLDTAAIQHLVLQVKNNTSPDAIETLLRGFEPMIESAISRRLPQSPQWRAYRDDLRQIGRIALFRAITRYDPGSKLPLVAYVALPVKGAIRGAIAEEAEHLSIQKCEIGSQSPAASDDESQEHEDPEATHTIHTTGERLAVREFIESLSPVERTAAEGIWVDGRSQAAMAREVGMSKMQMSRMLRRIVQRGQTVLAAMCED